MAPSNARREAFSFFHENAGGIVGSAAIGALELARAEQLLREAENLEVARIEWTMDEESYDYDPGADPPERVAERFASGEWTGPFGCIVRAGDQIASLWGVVLGSRGLDDPYARVVAAELASELLDDIRQAIGDAEDAEMAAELLERVRERETELRDAGDSERAEKVYALGCAIGSLLAN